MPKKRKESPYMDKSRDNDEKDACTINEMPLKIIL